jgi:hypothetical protein
MACKVCVRKFVLRVINYSEKSIENMGNMAFLVYLVVFNNEPDPDPDPDQETHIFKYFESLERHFLIGPIAIKNQDDHEQIGKNIFIDEKIILSYLEGFKMDEVFKRSEAEPAKHRKYLQNLIKAYLELEGTNELQDYLYKLEKVFLSKTKFKEFNQDDSKGIRSMISHYFVSSENGKPKDAIAPQELYVAEIIGLLLCLLVEESLNTHRENIFKLSLEQFVLFLKSFSLACCRDCLKKKDHPYRNEKLPTKIVYHLIHFLYEMMEAADNPTEKSLLE